MKKIVTFASFFVANFIYGQDIIDQTNQIGLPIFKKDSAILKNKIRSIDYYGKTTADGKPNLINKRIFDKGGFVTQNVDYSPKGTKLILNIWRNNDTVTVIALFEKKIYSDFIAKGPVQWIYYNWDPYNDLPTPDNKPFSIKKVYDISLTNKVIASTFRNDVFINKETLPEDFLGIFYDYGSSKPDTPQASVDSSIIGDTLVLISKTKLDSTSYKIEKIFFKNKKMVKKQAHFYTDDLLLNTYVWKYNQQNKLDKYEEFGRGVFGMTQEKAKEIKYEPSGNRIEIETTNFTNNIPDEKTTYDKQNRVIKIERFHLYYSGNDNKKEVQTEQWITLYNKKGLVEKETYLINKKVKSEQLYKYLYF